MPGAAPFCSPLPPQAPTRSMRQPAPAGQPLAGPQASLLFQVSGCAAAMQSVLWSRKTCTELIQGSGCKQDLEVSAQAKLAGSRGKQQLFTRIIQSRDSQACLDHPCSVGPG